MCCGRRKPVAKLSTERIVVLRYALMSIVGSHCINRGNLIIQTATRQLLGLDESTFEVDAYSRIGTRDLQRINSSAALILPGATLLQPGDHSAVESLGMVKVPILALGVSLRSELDLADLSVAHSIKHPIGSRDPFTHRALKASGFESHLVGCQTLYLGKASRWQERSGPIVFCPGLGDIHLQQDCIRACAAVNRVIVLCHAPEAQPFDSNDEDISVVPLRTATQAISLLSSASVVITGRIHALLVCLAFGTPAVFLGGWYDSRYSLLDLLGVSIEPPVPQRVRRIVDQVLRGKHPSEYCFQAADSLRASMWEFLLRVAQPMGLYPMLGRGSEAKSDIAN
jgi:hypothetical protein